jgi:hypothetical protein
LNGRHSELWYWKSINFSKAQLPHMSSSETLQYTFRKIIESSTTHTKVSYFFKITNRGYGLDTWTRLMEKQRKAGQSICFNTQGRSLISSLLQWVEVEKSSSAAVFCSIRWGGTRAAHRGRVSMFFALTRYRVVKIACSYSEVVLQTRKNYKAHYSLSWFRPLLLGNSPTSNVFDIEDEQCYNGGE